MIKNKEIQSSTSNKKKLGSATNIYSLQVKSEKIFKKYQNLFIIKK